MKINWITVLELIIAMTAFYLLKEFALDLGISFAKNAIGYPAV